MKNLRAAALSALLVIAGVTQAIGQSFPITMPANTLYGRLGVSSGPGSAIPLSTIRGQLSTTTSITAFGAKCDNSTDDSAAIQAAIDSLNPLLGGEITIPANGAQCKHSATISSNGRLHVLIRGGAVMGTALGNGSSLIYTGSGARGWDLRDSNGFVFQNVNIWASNASFTGILVDAGGNASSSFYFKLIESNILANLSGGSTCLNLATAQVALIDRVAFTGCNIAIQGQGVGGANTTTRITNSLFFATTTIPINDCGDNWVISNNTFEPLVSGNAGAMIVNSSRPCQALTFSGNWLGDGNTSGTWLTLTARGANITANRFGNGVAAIALTAGNGYTIKNNSFDTITTAVSFASSPTGGEIAANYYVNITNYTSGTPVNFRIQGVAGQFASSFPFVNATSGQITLAPVTGALGSISIAVPATSGTMATSGTAPVSVNATTGAISVATFTSGTSGIVPASGGGTSNFLRADGTWAAAGGSNITVGTTTITSGTNTRVLFDNSGVLGEYSITGTGNVAMSASPTFTGTITAAAANFVGNVGVTGVLGVQSSAATAFTAGPNGSTNPGIQVDASTASSATGFKIKSAAAGGGVALSLISSGSNENLTLDALGSGTMTFGGTSTGAITLSRATTASVSISSPIHQSTGSLTFNSNGSTFAGLINTSQQLIYGANQSVGATPTVIITKNASSVTNPIYSNAIMQLVNVDGTGTQIAMDSYGAAVSNGIQVRHARGTQATPTATQNTDTLWSFVANGYQTTTGAFGTLDSIFSLEALENFTSTARGNAWRFYTTAVGATGAAQRGQFASGFSVGTSTDPGVGRILTTSYIQTGTTTVGSLPTCNAGTKGARFFVTDANAATFKTTAAGGGANNVGVTCDGTNWYISQNDKIPANDNMRNYAEGRPYRRAA